MFNKAQSPLSKFEQVDSLNPTGVYVSLQDLIRLRFAAKDLSLHANKKVVTQLKGAERTRFRGRGMEFEEVRLYQPGDDIRSIDWRVTARTQKPHTKLYQEERERPIILLVDQRPSLFFGSQICFKSVMAAHLAATLAWAGLKHNDRIGGLILGAETISEIKPRRSTQAVLQLLQQMSEYNLALKSPNSENNSVSMAKSLYQLRQIIKPGTSLFIISDFYDFDSSCEQHLSLLAKHANVQLIQVFDPLEKQLANSQALFASNGQESTRLDVHQQSFQTHYAEIFEQRSARIQRLAQQNSILALSISTQDPLQTFLHRHFTD